MKFVGIVGRKATGKNDVVQFLHEYFINVKTLSFSEPIKQMVKIGYHFSDEQLENGKDIKDLVWNITPRNAMRSIASTMTALDEIHFVDLMCQRIRHTDTTGVEYMCISDIRFHNEADLVKNLGGLTIHVSNVKLHVDDPKFVHLDEHVSEVYSDEIKCDYYIVNDGNINNLKIQCDKIFEDINEKFNEKMSQSLYDQLQYVNEVNEEYRVRD